MRELCRPQLETGVRGRLIATRTSVWVLLDGYLITLALRSGLSLSIDYKSCVIRRSSVDNFTKLGGQFRACLNLSTYHILHTPRYPDTVVSIIYSIKLRTRQVVKVRSHMDGR